MYFTLCVETEARGKICWRKGNDDEATGHIVKRIKGKITDFGGSFKGKSQK